MCLQMQDAFVEQAVAHKFEQVLELFLRKPDRRSQQRIDASRGGSLERAGEEVRGNVVGVAS